MKLPGVAKFFKVKDETYASVLAVKDNEEHAKAVKYGYWIAEKENLSSLLFVADQFREMGITMKIMASSPLTILLPVTYSEFIAGLCEGIFSHVYGSMFSFRKISANAGETVLEGKVIGDKDAFFEIVDAVGEYDD